MDVDIATREIPSGGESIATVIACAANDEDFLCIGVLCQDVLCDFAPCDFHEFASAIGDGVDFGGFPSAHRRRRNTVIAVEVARWVPVVCHLSLQKRMVCSGHWRTIGRAPLGALLLHIGQIA